MSSQVDESTVSERTSRAPIQPRDRALAALIALAGILTYANTLWNRFSLDDVYIIEQNPRVHQLSDMAAIWLTPYWPTFGEYLGLYRPLAIFGYALQWAVGDGAPWVFHAVSVLLHVLVSLLVFALIKRLASRPAALIGALIFAVHPVHTEVVAGLVGQAEMMAAAAVLAACIVHIDRPQLEPSRLRLAVLVALYALGLLAKEGAVVLPGLLVALDFATGRVRLTRNSLAAYARSIAGPLLILMTALAAYLTLRISILGSIGGVDAAPNLPFLRQGHRFMSALRAWPEYARLLVFPADLSADYSPGVVLPVESLSPMVMLGALLLAGTVALCLATPWLPAAGLPAAWFFIAVFPVSNILLPIGVLLAERILYLPSVAIAIVAAYVWDFVRGRFSIRELRLATATTVVILVAGMGRSFLRNPDWKDTETLWDSIVRDHPESYRAQWTNGFRMARLRQTELARGFFEIAYRIWPDDAVLNNNLAGTYLQLGRYGDAVPVLLRSRDLVDDVLDTTDQLLAWAYIGLGEHQKALDATLSATQNPGARSAVMALRAQAYEGLGQLEKSAGTWRYAIRSFGGDTPTFWMMLSRVLARAGHREQAIAAVDTAHARVQRGAPIEAKLAQLRTAIVSDCYANGASPDSNSDSAAASCSDPMAEWRVILPPAQEVATALQNAR
jgi:tetratricopeptide (TPR) repeat protein